MWMLGLVDTCKYREYAIGVRNDVLEGEYSHVDIVLGLVDTCE
jgi:hypothetical protein